MCYKKQKCSMLSGRFRNEAFELLSEVCVLLGYIIYATKCNQFFFLIPDKKKIAVSFALSQSGLLCAMWKVLFPLSYNVWPCNYKKFVTYILGKI